MQNTLKLAPADTLALCHLWRSGTGAEKFRGEASPCQTPSPACCSLAMDHRWCPQNTMPLEHYALEHYACGTLCPQNAVPPDHCAPKPLNFVFGALLLYCKWRLLILFRTAVLRPVFGLIMR